MPRVRAELGYPPLVTPTSQIVGSMAALNVTLGVTRWSRMKSKTLCAENMPHTCADRSWSQKTGYRWRTADRSSPCWRYCAANGKPEGQTGCCRLSQRRHRRCLSYALFPDVALAYFKKHRWLNTEKPYVIKMKWYKDGRHKKVSTIFCYVKIKNKGVGEKCPDQRVGRINITHKKKS